MPPKANAQTRRRAAQAASQPFCAKEEEIKYKYFRNDREGFSKN